MKIRNIVLMALLILGAAAQLVAQDSGDDTADSPIVVAAWQRIDLAEDASSGEDAAYVVFLAADEGATLIEVAPGEDVIYTATDEVGVYSGAPLVATDAYEFAATLEVIDEETMQVMATIEAGTFTTERNLRYERNDIEYGVWLEGERDLSEWSLFVECLGREGGDPPGGWANPDPILAIRVDDSAGTLTIGNTVLTGGGGSYELIEEAPFAAYTQLITQTATVTDERIDFSYYAIAGGRDDCELRYETSYTPFRGDYDALFDRATDLADSG